jgi:hypothetical protein
LDLGRRLERPPTELFGLLCGGVDVLDGEVRKPARHRAPLVLGLFAYASV